MTDPAVEGLVAKLASTKASVPVSEKTMAKLSEASAADQLQAALEEEMIPCFACGGTGKTPPAVPYRVMLKNGFTFETFARMEPRELSRLVQKARKDNETLLWADGQFTEAIEIAHVQVYDGESDDEEEGDDEGVDESKGEGDSESADADGKE
jgi:hypothetical protein